MAEGLQLTLKAALDGFYTASAVPGSAVEDAIDFDQVLSYVTGSGADQADGIYVEAVNLAASASETDNLNSLTDPLGQALSFTRVKAVILFASAANVNDIILGAAGSTPFVGPMGGTAPTINTRPGGMTILADPGGTGWLTSGANNLKLANSAGGSAVTGTLIVIGARE